MALAIGPSPLGVGLIPDLALLMGIAAAAISLFTARSVCPGRNRWQALLLLGGGLSLLLSIDQLSVLTERSVGSTYLSLLYPLLAFAILVRWADLVFLSGGALNLVSAAFLLGSSVLLDLVQGTLPFSHEAVQIVEQGIRFIGIACWLLFWWQAAAFAAKLRTTH